MDDTAVAPERLQSEPPPILVADADADRVAMLHAQTYVRRRRERLGPALGAQANGHVNSPMDIAGPEGGPHPVPLSGTPGAHTRALPLANRTVAATIAAPPIAAHTARRVLVAALGLGGCVDLLFYGKMPGISVPLFVLLVLGVLLTLARMELVRVEWRNIWLVAPLLFFAGMVVLRANGGLTAMNIAAVGVLLLMLVYFFTEGRVEQLGLLGYPKMAGRVLGAMLSRPAPLASEIRREASANPDHTRRLVQVLRGVLIAAPILIVFTALLSSADAVFEGYVTDVLKLDFMKDAPEMGFRICIILAASWLAAGLLLYALAPRTVAAENLGAPTTALGPAGAAIKRRGAGFIEGALVLGLVNVLFGLFAWIQFAVLFSGEAARTMHFEEYREYVRRGFGELLAVAVLTMLLILGLRWAMRWITEGQARVVKALFTVMIALTMVMLVSAFMRMVVWEGIAYYINTPTRLYVRTFIVWLGLLFVWLLFTTWFRRDRFAVGALVAAIGFLVTANLLNPDADVAAYNLRRNDELSTRYLYLLSEDAVPALVAGLDTTSGFIRADLSYHLSLTLEHMRCVDDWQQWQSFNISRWDAYNSLVRAAEQGKIDRLKPSRCAP